MLYYPMTALTPPFFDKHRGFAMGVALSGSGAGGLVFAPIIQTLLARWGSSATLRILGVWNFVVLIPISFIIRRPPGYSPMRPTLALAKRGVFILQVSTATRFHLGPIFNLMFIALCRVPPSGREHHTFILSILIFGFSTGLLGPDGQHVLGREQRSQQCGTRHHRTASRLCWTT